MNLGREDSIQIPIKPTWNLYENLSSANPQRKQGTVLG
jgi:hypothetical protein